MKPNEFKAFSQSGSKSFRALNPHLFGVGGLRAAEPQHAQGEALERGEAGQGPRPQRVGGSVGPIFRVHFVTFLNRLSSDGDNRVPGLKPLRDAIAASLGVDDNDRIIDWQYGPPRYTPGRQGVIVGIEGL